jgi:hypothetical protein
MKIKSIKAVGRKPVYDLSVNSNNYDEQQYVLRNGVVTHNTGIYYSADNIWILGRRQNKTGTEITGYDFVINVEKSRYVKEKSKIPISVSWDGGIEQYSGLLDVALAGNYVAKPSNGWYCKVDRETGELLDPKVRMKDTLEEDFWHSILNDTDFKEFVKKQFTIGYKTEVELEIAQEV